MFRKLGAVVYKARRWVIAIWLVVSAIGIVAQGPLSERVTAEFAGSERIEAARVLERLNSTAPTGGDIAIVIDGVDVAPDGPPDEITAMLADVAAVDGVISVVDPWTAGPISDQLVAAEGQPAALVVVSYVNGLDLEAERDLTESVSDLSRQLEGASTSAGTVTDVLVGGEPIVLQEFEKQAEEDLLQGEAIAIPIALFAMIFIFGGFRAAGMPLAVAAAGFLTAGVALLAATFVLDSVSVFALNVVSMLGLGLGIDYGLLLVSRFREERALGADVGNAVETTVATAGVTVVFSALTVAVAMSGMFVFQDPTMTSFGVGGLAAVLFSMVAALTLLPALLGLFGAKIRPAKVQPNGFGAFYRLSRRVQRFALPILLLVGTGLALLATPFFDANLENGDPRSLPRSSEARATALTLADRFPSRGAAPIVVIADVDPDNVASLEWSAELASMENVAGIQPRDGFPSGVTVVDVVPDGTSQGEMAMDLVNTIRDRGAETEFTVEVGGLAASTMDSREMIGNRVPWAISVVVAATLILLFLMTGSIAIPIKAVVMNVLSLGASFGALVWVFQDGNLSGLLAFDPIGSIDLWLPTIIFLFAFGLSMDYEVFLLGRIKEIHDRGVDNDQAVSMGLQKTGRIITSAAFLIVVVFAGFAAGETLTIKQLGVGLALAVIVDATVVRSLLVPATMKLLGEWNWWAPATLRRMHNRFGLSEPGQVEIGDETAAEPHDPVDSVTADRGWRQPRELVDA